MYKIKSKQMGNIFSWLIAIYIIAMPFEEALASSAGTLLRYLGIVICIIGIFILAKFKVKFSLNSVHILLFLWITLSIASYFWSDSYTWWEYYIKIYSKHILMFTIITIVPVKFYNIDVLKLGMILCSLVTSILLIISPNGSTYTDEGRRTVMIFNTILDPNIVAVLILIGLFILAGYLLDLNRFIKHKFLYMFIILILLIGILYTGSRGGLISTVIGFIILSIYKLRERISMKYIVYIGILISVFSISYNFLPDELINSRFTLYNLLGKNEIDSGSHSRYKIWSFVPTLIKEKPFLGYGTGNFFEALKIVYRSAASHNMYLLLLVENGFIGATLFISSIIITLKKILNLKMYEELSLFVAILCSCIFLDALPYKFFWIIFSLMHVFIKNKLVNREGVYDATKCSDSSI